MFIHIYHRKNDTYNNSFCTEKSPGTFLKGNKTSLYLVVYQERKMIKIIMQVDMLHES